MSGTSEDRKRLRAEMRERALDRLSAMVDTAIDTIQELATMADSETVRLNAAQTILRGADVNPAQKREVSVSLDDRRAVKAELAETLKKLQRGNPEAVAALTQGRPDVTDMVERDGVMVAEEELDR